MHTLIGRWLRSPRRAADVAADEVKRWAASQGHRFARIRGSDGFVVEPSGGSGAWRIECGPSQRRYLEGDELRVRIGLGAIGELQMLAATMPLMARLEREVYEQAIEDNRTRVDDDTPEEMRWMVLYPRTSRQGMGVLRDRFGALASISHAAVAWLDDAVTKELVVSSEALGVDAPLAIIVQRDRLVLRTAATPMTPARLQSALALAVAAAASARRVAAAVASGALASQQREH
jgi:hypothetical protein